MSIKVKFFLWAVGLAISVLPHANALATEKVAYVSKVPTEIRRGAVGRKYTRFFGKTTINGQNLAFHFYDTSHLETNDKGETFQKSRLDVYVETRIHNRLTYKRINTTSLTYTRPQKGAPETETTTVKAEKLWLNSNTQTQPVLHLKVITSFHFPPQNTGDKLYESKSGSDILFIFPQGMTSQAVVQQFDTFDDPLAFIAFCDNDFNILDKEGYLTVYRQTSSFGATNFEGWKWNGTQFVQVDRAFLDVGENAECKWDGEKITKKVWSDAGSG